MMYRILLYFLSDGTIYSKHVFRLNLIDLTYAKILNTRQCYMIGYIYIYIYENNVVYRYIEIYR